MKTLLSAIVLAFLIPQSAQAFCGTYVGSAGVDIYSHKSQVAIVRQGNTTTLTLANDYDGDLSEFALVIPVPDVLDEDDVTIVDPSIFSRLDEYSSPRRVVYECTDFNDFMMEATADEDGGGGGGGGMAATGVTVEAEFIVGNYEIVILSAAQSTGEGLTQWLNDNGYSVTTDASDMLQEYIDGGSYFFAAKVTLSDSGDLNGFLDPLQFSYESSFFGLPIRLGTLNADGPQELFVFAINDSSLGYVGISNYSEAEVEDVCMWMPEESTFADFYDEQFSNAVDSVNGAGWVREYSWNTSGCDPCPTTPPTDEEVHLLGYNGSAYETYFTRLHMRYTKEQAGQDLVFYHSNFTDNTQERFIDYAWDQEENYPICGEGMVENPGSCTPCDDGTWVDCNSSMDWWECYQPPICEDDTILAVQEGAYICVDVDTCETPQVCSYCGVCETNPYDLNADASVNVTDIIEMVSCVLDDCSVCVDCGNCGDVPHDLSNDNLINVVDVIKLIQCLLWEECPLATIKQ